MKEKHYVITVDENLVIKSAEGNIKRNSNSSQWFDLLLDGWLLNDGEGLYIELLHYDEDAELTTRVGPLYFVLNRDLGRYVTLVPPEVFSLAGEWKYSLELRRYDDDEVDKTVTTVITVTDDTGETVSQTTIVKSGADCIALIEDGEAEPGEKKFDSLTSAVYSLTVIDSIVSATNGDCNIKESELLTAAEVFYKNLHNAETANSEAKEAQQAAEAAQRSAETAQSAAETAQDGAERAETSALKHSEDAAAFAADAEKEATRATMEAQAAEASAKQAENFAAAAQSSASEAERHKSAAEDALNRAAIEAVNAAESSKIAENWARQAAELFATHSIKISTEFASVADLPADGNSQTIYFIPNGGENENSFDEYVWVESKAAYEKIGSTEVDLTSYATKTEIAEKEKTLQSDIEQLYGNIERLEIADNLIRAEEELMRSDIDQLYGNTERLETADNLIHARISEVDEFAETKLAEETAARESADQQLEERIDSNDTAISALQSSKVKKSGDVMTGPLRVNDMHGVSVGARDDLGMIPYTDEGYEQVFTQYGNAFHFWMKGGTEEYIRKLKVFMSDGDWNLIIPPKSGTLAYKDDIPFRRINFLHDKGFLLIGRLPKNDDRNNASISVMGRIGGWTATNSSTVQLMIMNRGGFTVTGFQSQDAPYRIYGLRKTDDSVEVYIEFTEDFALIDVLVLAYEADLPEPTFSASKPINGTRLTPDTSRVNLNPQFSKTVKGSIPITSNTSRTIIHVATVAAGNSPSLLTVFGAETEQHGAIMITSNTNINSNWSNDNNNDTNILAKAEGEQGYWSRQYLCCSVLIPANQTVYIYTRCIDHARYTLQPIFNL